MSFIPVGPEPSNMTCPSCKTIIVTKIEHKASLKTHIVAVALCLLLCWPCICVPYCVKPCLDVEHFCPSCNAYLGTYKR